MRTSATGIAPLTRLGTDLGFEVRTRVSAHPKVYRRTTAATGVQLRIKIEVNTHERSPVLPPIRHEHGASSSWWTGSAPVATFQPTELVATKIRALYQRSKGRDLFDLWLALDHRRLDPHHILTAFGPYRPEGLTAARAQANLAHKLSAPPPSAATWTRSCPHGPWATTSTPRPHSSTTSSSPDSDREGERAVTVTTPTLPNTRHLFRAIHVQYTCYKEGILHAISDRPDTRLREVRRRIVAGQIMKLPVASVT